MKKFTQIFLGASLFILLIGNPSSALFQKAQADDWWNHCKIEIAETRVEGLTDTYYPDYPVVQGLYTDWADGVSGWAWKTFLQGENMYFRIHVTDPNGGDVLYEFAIFRGDKMVYQYSYPSFHDPGSIWRLNAYLSIPLNAPLGEYKWTARFTDGLGYRNVYPARLPIEIVTP